MRWKKVSSRPCLGKVWGFLCAHATFEAVFQFLISSAICHICCLCFSFYLFFLTWNSGLFCRKEGARGLQALLGGVRVRGPEHLHRPSTPLHQGHDHIGKQPGVRGEKTDGDPGLPDPTPPLKTRFRKWFSVKADFRGQCFHKHSFLWPVSNAWGGGSVCHQTGFYCISPLLLL